MLLSNTVGLIIDAFGELRDQQEQVKEDMEVKQHFHFKWDIFTSCLLNMASYLITTCFVCRQNASYVELEVTTLTQHHMDLRLTLWMNTTWPITCE